MDFEKEIFSFLAKADELLVLLTRPAVKSHFVFLEIGAARVRNLTIAGILYGITARDLQSMPGIPSVVKELNLLDINQVEKYFEQLAKRCSTRPKTPKKS